MKASIKKVQKISDSKFSKAFETIGKYKQIEKQCMSSFSDLKRIYIKIFEFFYNNIKQNNYLVLIMKLEYLLNIEIFWLSIEF